MHLVDLAAALAAVRHARCPVVTASVDQMSFLHPVHIGQLIMLRSSVNRVFRTSMEVGVRVQVENLITGERKHTSSAYLTFVAMDKSGRRVPIAPVIPETDEEKRRFARQGSAGTYRWRCGTKLYESSNASSLAPALYMYLMFGLKISRFGWPSRFTFRQVLSYHSITPSSVSPSFITKTMGVLACICFM